MISKSELKFIKSLQIKKYRKEHQKFIVQGEKSVLELANSNLKIELILCVDELRPVFQKQFPNTRVEIVKREVLTSVSSFKTNDAALAIVEMLDNTPLQAADNEWVVVLDDVRDPGNLGTIIRICDWYGIPKIICSDTSADLYNPKVIASSMGSFTRVKVYYTDLATFFDKQQREVYGAFMNGESVYEISPSAGGYILMGNESKGISDVLENSVTHKITIPKVGGAESLNVGVATAIILDNFTRATTQS